MPYYKVVGRHEVLDHEPGEVFEADLSPAEHELLGIGHLAVVADAPAVAVTEASGASSVTAGDQDEDLHA